MKSSKKLRRAQKATMDIGAGKTKMGKKKPRQAMKGTKSPNGNQPLYSRKFLDLPAQTHIWWSNNICPKLTC